MSAPEKPLEGTVVDEAPQVAPVPSQALTSPENGSDKDLLGSSPEAVLAQTVNVANQQREFLRQQNLVKNIQGNDHILVEGWQLLGMMVGCTAAPDEPQALRDGSGNVRQDEKGRSYGFTCHAILIDKNGQKRGAGSGRCDRSEKMWKHRDDYALASMAQTRAIGKAFRGTFGFVAKAAGLEATPVEEMPRSDAGKPPKPSRMEQVKRSLESGPHSSQALAEWLGVKRGKGSIKESVEKLSDEGYEKLLLWLGGAK